MITIGAVVRIDTAEFQENFLVETVPIMCKNRQASLWHSLSGIYHKYIGIDSQTQICYCLRRKNEIEHGVDAWAEEADNIQEFLKILEGDRAL